MILLQVLFCWRQSLCLGRMTWCYFMHIYTRVRVRQTEIWFQHTAYKMSGTYSSPKYNYVCLVVVMFYWWIVWRLNYALQAFLRVMLEYSCRNTVDIISTTRCDIVTYLYWSQSSCQPMLLQMTVKIVVWSSLNVPQNIWLQVCECKCKYEHQFYVLNVL